MSNTYKSLTANATVTAALNRLGILGEVTPEMALQWERDYEAWAARPTKRFTEAARTAGIKKALARIFLISSYGGTEENAIEQLRREML